MPIHVYTFSRGDIVEAKGRRGVITEITDYELYIDKEDGSGLQMFALPIKDIKLIQRGQRCPDCGSLTADYLYSCADCGKSLDRTSSARVILGH
nr:MAG TPA_asm: RimK-related lysine biosynthesis protein, Probable-dependent amine/thiol ligase family Amino-group [Caudoviricetes sp.]